MYLLFRLALLLIPRLPPWLISTLGRVVALLAWLLVRPARKQATVHIQRVLHFQHPLPSPDRQQVQRTVRRLFHCSVRNYLDACTLPTLEADALSRRVTVHGVNAGGSASRLRTGRPGKTNSKEQKERNAGEQTPVELRRENMSQRRYAKRR